MLGISTNLWVSVSDRSFCGEIRSYGSTYHGDESIRENPSNKEDFEDGKVEFGDTEVADRDNVDRTIVISIAFVVR